MGRDIMATSEHWQQVQDLFHAALERGPGDRSGFLAEACSGNENLRKEIETLIVAHEEGEHFIDSPAYMATAEILTDVQQFEPGQTLGHYEICSVLGEGGMGKRSEEHTSELQSRGHLVCRLLLEK